MKEWRSEILNFKAQLGKNLFTRGELLEFFHRKEPRLRDTTFRWRIYELLHEGEIKKIDKATYTFERKDIFYPLRNDLETEIWDSLMTSFHGLIWCTWNTAILNAWMRHQPSKFFILVEVEKAALIPVFNLLKDQRKYDVYLNPTKRDIEYYIAESENTVIVRSLVSKAPLQKLKDLKGYIHGINYVSLEKILVDLICDKDLFYTYQGSELVNIYANSTKTFLLDVTRLLAYARRRNRYQEIRAFLKENTELLSGEND